jgi:hypothetical protein
MNIAEILRKMADIVDQAQDPGRPDDSIQNPARLSATALGAPVDNPDNQDAGEDDPVMIPPLQLKTELLKKAVGVDSVFDPGEPRADEAHDNQHDELEIIRRHAGVPVAAIQELSNDEPLDD